MPLSVPDGLGVRIPGFHPGGPGSIPGLGALFFEIEPSHLYSFILKRACATEFLTCLDQKMYDFQQ